MKPTLLHPLLLLLPALWLLLLTPQASAQTTAFTYQGHLMDNGASANGNYDIQFTLKNALTAGSTVGTPQVIAPVTAVNGVFNVMLDFGSGPFDGSNRWVELAVRPYGSVADYTVLAPRHQLTSAPHAVRALNAGAAVTAATATNATNAANLTGTLTGGNVPAEFITGSMLANGAVTSANLAAGAIGSAQLAANAVQNGNITNSSVTTAKLADNSITSAKLADGAVGSVQLADTIALGDAATTGQLDVFQAANAVPVISLQGTSKRLLINGDDGLARTFLESSGNLGRLTLLGNSGSGHAVNLIAGSSGGALTLFSNNKSAVILQADTSLGGTLALDDTTGRLRVVATSESSGGSLTLFNGTSNSAIDLSGSTGAVTAATYKLSSPQARVLQISANGFVPDNPNEGYNRGAGLISPSGDTQLLFLANVHLPDGATVTKLVAVLYDAGTESFTDIDVRLRYFTTSSLNSVTMAEILDQNTIGQSGGRVEFEDATISGAVIDNTTRAYTVDANFAVDSATTNTRFYGVRIEYTSDTLHP